MEHLRAIRLSFQGIIPHSIKYVIVIFLNLYFVKYNVCPIVLYLMRSKYIYSLVTQELSAKFTNVLFSSIIFRALLHD